MAENTQKKQILRRDLLARRKALPHDVKALSDAAISTRLRAWIDDQRRSGGRPITVLGVYWPIRGEPDLRPLYTLLAQSGLQLALPVSMNKEAPLAFAQWSPDQPLELDAMGVPVPLHAALIEPDAVVIPCVGFNAQRFRLGYGGGFYDRTLAAADRPLTIGIAYDIALADFASEAHDVALDVILTETRRL